MITFKEAQKHLCKRYSLNACEAAEFISSEEERIKRSWRTIEDFDKYLTDLEELGGKHEITFH